MRMHCDVQGWAEALVLWANMVYRDDACRRVYVNDAGRNIFLTALSPSLQAVVLEAAQNLFPPDNGQFDRYGRFIGHN